MTYKDILVYADAHPPAAARLDVAVAVASAHKAHLTAVHAWSPPYVSFDAGAGSGELLVQWQENYRRDAALGAKRAVEEAACRCGQNIEWRCVRADAGPALMFLSRFADLVVLSRSRGGPPEEALEAVATSRGHGRAG